MINYAFTTYLKITGLLAAALLFNSNSWAIGACPAVGQSPSCAALITINPNGSLKIQVDGSVPPYDGVEDSLVGVINNSGASVFGIKLTGQDIFGFDGGRCIRRKLCWPKHQL